MIFLSKYLFTETTRKYANVSHGNIKEEDTSHTKSDQSLSSVPPPLPKRPTNPVKINEGTTCHIPLISINCLKLKHKHDIHDIGTF